MTFTETEQVKSSETILFDAGALNALRLSFLQRKRKSAELPADTKKSKVLGRGDDFRKLILSTFFYALLSCVFVSITGIASAQTDTTQQKKQENIDEWKEIYKLRKKFYTNQYGSLHFISLFDGRFVGPNMKDNYGTRTFTTAYDYLIFGNQLLAMLVNLGMTADKIQFLPASKTKDHHPYPLGCIMSYSISEVKYWVDSTYNQAAGKKVPVEKPFWSRIPRLNIDSAQVIVELAGFYTQKKENKKTTYDTLLIPQIEGTGSWKDANNFDMVYEWFEMFFSENADRLDVSKRTFSKKTPQFVRECILERFNTKKYLETNSLSEDQLKFRLKDRYKNEIYDFLSVPNGEVVTCGSFEFFRYFNDIYWRNVNDTIVMNGIGKNLSGREITIKYVWLPGDKKNPVWHCAFQYDKDREVNPENGLISFIMLPYGTQGRTMPTVIHNDYPQFSQFEGVVLWSENVKKQTYTNKDDIWINTLNGRMINKFFYCYSYEPGILPLNDDGTVDGIYRIYAWKDNKEYWAYIYCGKHAGVRNGRPGKSLVDQVEAFRKNYNFSDYWYFVKEVDFREEVKNKMSGFITKLENLQKKEKGITGKTMLKIHVPIEISVDKNPKKKKVENHYLVLDNQNTGVLYPEKINVFWEIQFYDDYQEGMLVKRRSVIITIGRDEVALEDLEDYLKTKKFTPSEIRKANRDFADQLQMIKNAPQEESLIEVYNNNLYNLGNTDETYKLIEVLKEDLALVRYELPKAERDLEEWQDNNSHIIKSLKKKLDELEKNRKTKKQVYIETKQEYDKLVATEEKKLYRYNKLVSREEKLLDLLHKCYVRLEINLENDLAAAQSRIDFLTEERNKYEKLLKQLKAEGKTNTEYYRQIETTISNKKQELEEAEQKRARIKQMLDNHKRLQSQED